MSSTTIKLPSGATLEIGHVPFAEAHELQKAMAFELKSIAVGVNADVSSIIKDGICSFIYSEKFNKAMKVCWARCLYNGEKLTEEVFDKVEAREDYFEICFRVTEEVTRPFMKGLFARFEDTLQKVSELTSRPKTTTS